MKILKLKKQTLIRLWEGTLLLYIDKDSGEIVKEIKYFREDLRNKNLRWRYFAGCKSPTEVSAIKKHMDNFFKLHNIEQDDIEYIKFHKEYVKALSSKYPLSDSRGSSDWILDAYEQCLVEGKKPSSLWFEYERRATIIKDIVPCRKDLEKIQKLLGYKKGWVWYKFQQLKI